MQTQQAARAASFAVSIGVNTHLNDYLTSYGNLAGDLSELRYLGVDTIRDNPPQYWTLSNYETLAAAGVKMDLAIGYNPGFEMGGGAIQNSLSVVASVDAYAPGSIIGVEGLNEPNKFPDTWNGQPTDNWTTVEQVQAAESAALAATPALAGVPLLDASVDPNSFPGTVPDMAPYADLGNAHVYPYNGGQPPLVMNGILAGQAQLVPGKPAWITEFGYSSSYDDPTNYGVDEGTQAKNTLNGLLDALKGGVPMTFLYELNEEVTNPSPSTLENGFGLFTNTGAAKPVANALHNLTTILGDAGGSARTFAPGSLSYALTGLPPTGKSLLLEKSDGSFDLVVWNEAADWNYANKSDVPVAPATVSLSLANTYRNLDVFDPLSGPAALSQATDASTVTLQLTDHPVVVQITSPVASSPAQITATASAGQKVFDGIPTAVRNLAVTDSRAGEALAVTLSATGGTLSIPASAGGTLAGSGTASIALAGTAAQVNAELGSLSFTATSANNGSVTASVTNPAGTTAAATEGITVLPNTVSLSLAEDAYLGNAQFVAKVNGAAITGATGVSTLKSGGGSEVFLFRGDYGAHPTVEVDFVNDLYGGSPGLDRNLYVNNIQYDGVSQMTAPAALDWNTGYQVAVSTPH